MRTVITRNNVCFSIHRNENRGRCVLNIIHVQFLFENFFTAFDTIVRGRHRIIIRTTYPRGIKFVWAFSKGFNERELIPNGSGSFAIFNFFGPIFRSLSSIVLFDGLFTRVMIEFALLMDGIVAID
uniref:Uncharacterized protein n=1 Tax=Lepeophtheirus salmonis TaxID=72036 RepID=A0A0K2TXB1_LEPSM